MLAGDAERMALVCPHADKDRFIPLVEKIIQGVLSLRTDGGVEIDFDSQAFYPLDLAADHLPG